MNQWQFILCLMAMQVENPHAKLSELEEKASEGLLLLGNKPGTQTYSEIIGNGEFVVTVENWYSMETNQYQPRFFYDVRENK